MLEISTEIPESESVSRFVAADDVVTDEAGSGLDDADGDAVVVVAAGTDLAKEHDEHLQCLSAQGFKMPCSMR